MDKEVLLKKRKTLLLQSKGSKELLLTHNFINPLTLIPTSELLSFIFNKFINTITIHKGTLSKNITNLFNSVTDIITFKKVLEDLGVTDYQIDESLNSAALAKEVENIKKKIINEKFDILDSLLNYSLKARVEYSDSSIWKMFLSYGSIIGESTYSNKEPITLRAPLLNIEIIAYASDDGCIIISKNNEGIVEQNQILLQTLEDQYAIKLNVDINNDSEANDTTIPLTSIPDNYFTSLAKAIPNCEVENEFSVFLPINKDEITENYKDRLVIQKNFVISLINPIGGKLLRDYDELLEENYQFPTVDTIFTNNLNELIYEKDQIFELNHPLNLVQKMAVVNSLNKNLLIYGPPGTGKSEVVTNIIANALIQNKRILVCSEKKAALNVLDERLMAVNQLVMSAFDNNSKDVFYNRLLELNNLILSATNVSINQNDSGYLNIKNYLSELGKLTDFKDLYGKNLQHILEVTKTINLETYKTNKNVLSSFTYYFKDCGKQLSDVVNNIKNLSSIYQEFKKLIPNTKINQNIFDLKLTDEFLNTIATANEKDVLNFLLHFIATGEVLKKRHIFGKKYKDEKTANKDNLLNAINKIKQLNIFYIPDYESYQTLFNSVVDYENYLSYDNWTTNTSLNQFIQKINDNKDINNILHNYWKNKEIQASKFDRILVDFYASNLREKLMKDHELDAKWTQLVRKANLAKRPSVNRTIKAYYSVLKEIFPIWILSPDSAASILPLNKEEFDVGIFDESSQMKIERGIPLIYRCKFSTVSGDDKQLKPSAFFTKNAELNEIYEGHLDNVDSLLDKAKSSNWSNYTLMNHYRAINEELMYYSNHYFYDDKLVCITKNNCFDNSIDLIEVNGVYNREKGINEAETDQVIHTLVDSLDKYKAMIVVTFNIKQAEHIQSLANAHQILRQKIEDLSLKIRSLENVQGDEADLVVISTTFGKDSQGRFIQNFGPINQDGGMNRINVMASRAKKKMIVIKSFKSSDITNDSNRNTYVFKGFIQFVEQLQENPRSLEIQNLRTNKNNSLLLEQVVTQLKYAFKDMSDVEIIPNIAIGTHTIDIGIKHKLEKPINVLIIFDDEYKLNSYLSNNNKFIDDIDKEKYYEDRQYRTIRTNCYEWLINPDLIIKYAKALLAL